MTIYDKVTEAINAMIGHEVEFTELGIKGIVAAIGKREPGDYWPLHFSDGREIELYNSTEYKIIESAPSPSCEACGRPLGEREILCHCWNDE